MLNAQLHEVDEGGGHDVVGRSNDLSGRRGAEAARRSSGRRGRRAWVEHAAEAEAEAEAWEREHAAEWVSVDQKLRDLAARRALLDVEEARLLRYAEELKLWRGWGCGSLVEYLERAVGYHPHTAAERLRVARLLGELSLIEDALERGELAHSAVRELSRVAVPDTEEDWLEAVSGKSLREIEAMVSGHKPGDLPTGRRNVIDYDSPSLLVLRQSSEAEGPRPGGSSAS